MTISNAVKYLTGRCQCGNIRYQINGEPLTLYACHCLDCQKQSSSAFGLSMWVSVGDFIVLQGALKFWSTTVDDGSEKRCAFCPECGTRIYHALDDTPEIFSLKAGTLDDTSTLEPVAHIWVKRAHHWLNLAHGEALCYDADPVSFKQILSAWSVRNRVM